MFISWAKSLNFKNYLNFTFLEKRNLLKWSMNDFVLVIQTEQKNFFWHALLESVTHPVKIPPDVDTPWGRSVMWHNEALVSKYFKPEGLSLQKTFLLFFLGCHFLRIWVCLAVCEYLWTLSPVLPGKWEFGSGGHSTGRAWYITIMQLNFNFAKFTMTSLASTVSCNLA